MDRRHFIRLVGGSAAIAAAGAPLAGCSTEYPSEAVAAWRGPGDEADVRRWILGYAILAPHSHNLQSWLVDLSTPGEIVLYCDRDRLLPETDPFSRQIMMSQGTFIELVDIAARERGLRADVALFPEGAFGPTDPPDARPVARIRLQPDAAVAKDPLFAQILRRHTNRNAYDAQRAVPAAAWQAMADAVQPYPLRFGHVGADDPAALQRQRDIAAEAWKIEMTTPQAMLETYKVLRVGAGEVARHRDGVTVMDPMAVLMSRLGLFDRSKPPQAGDYATRRQIDDFNAKLVSTPAFLWMVSRDNERATQVDAGRAYVRVQLAATAHGVVMQPLQQALQEYPQQAGPYAAIRDAVGATSPAQTVQMWARVGHAPPAPPAPRRGVDAHVVRG
jgi:hypothetical protein